MLLLDQYQKCSSTSPCIQNGTIGANGYPNLYTDAKPCEMNGTLKKIRFILYRGVIIDQ